MNDPTGDFDLTTEAGREGALDALGQWFAEAIAATGGERAVASTIIARAIAAFYDIREAGDQPRGMFAGHFFMVDGVGLAASDRPVPWDELAMRVTPEELEVYLELFDQIERTVD